jgi:hypothetical protein
VGRTLVATVLAGMLFVAAARATPAPTRAEYIAQVDPICQTFVGPMNLAWRAYRKSASSAEAHLDKGTYGNWVRLVRQTAKSLDRLAETRTAMVDQIAGVPPAVSDVQAVDTWLSSLRQESGFEISAASALRKLRFGKANHRSTQADHAQAAANRAIAGFGFQVCGVSV